MEASVIGEESKRRRVSPVAIGVTVAYGMAIALLMALYALSVACQIPMMYFTADPGVLPEHHLYNGFLSNIGVLLWLAAAVACFVSYGVCREARLYREWSRFFLISGLVSAVLMLDDLYMLHEYVMVDLVGISQEIVYGLYLLIIVAYLVCSARPILKTRYSLLLLAFGFFALSFGVDAVQTTITGLLGDESIEYLLEDGSKFLGLVGWSSYFVVACVSFLKSAVRAGKAESYLPQ